MEQKKTIEVTLEAKEIKFDVMNKSHLTGQARNAEGKDYRATAYMQASEDDSTLTRYSALSAMPSHILRLSWASICMRMARRPTTVSIRL